MTQEEDRMEPMARSVSHKDEDVAGGRLLLGWSFVIAGLVLLIVGWFGVSGHAIVAVQLPYFISGGIGGLFCGIIGVGLLVSDDVRRDRARIGRLEAAVLEIRELVAAQSTLLQDREEAHNERSKKKA
ncbi:MAG: hypothetical protein ACYDCC_14385 [Actinomycetota bacterium]